MTTSTHEPVPTPAELLGWLVSVGWEEVERGPKWATVRQARDGRETLIDVPLLAEARDYPHVVNQLIGDLAQILGRSAEAVLADVRCACVDVIRLALRGPGLNSGGLGLGASVGALQGARDLLLAAACSAIDPRPAYLGRKPAQAMSILDLARWSRVERGSVVLCLELPVPPQLQGVLFDPSGPDPELARRVTSQLATGMAALQAALPACAAANNLEPALLQVRNGVSANLCEAVVALMEEAQAEELGLSVGFAARRPALARLARGAVMQRRDVSLLREVARGLQGRASEVDTTVVGPVVRLDSKDPASGGAVTLQIELNGRTRLVELNVGAEDYRHAVQAHQDFKFVRVSGTLNVRPSGIVLTRPGPLQQEGVRDGDGPPLGAFDPAPQEAPEAAQGVATARNTSFQGTKETEDQ